MKFQNTIIPVILSGGHGTRLWPLSRKQYPKQYLPLVGDNTMLQETILRLNGLDNLANPIIVCNAEHRFLVAEQCQQINISNPTILLEPVGRNTAPAIAAAALQALKITDNGVLLVLSADHVIEDINAFHQAIDSALKQANDNKLVTFGIVPTDANTGYGYIKSLKNGQVEAFVEKPDLQTAQSYLKQGNYLWNSGMFMFQSQTLIDEFTMHSPNIVSAVSDAVNNATQDLDFIRLEKQAFELSPSNSIDYALMEKSNNVVVVPLDAGWSDIGSWSALYDIGMKDDNGNVIKGDVITQDTVNTYINANHHMVATIGVQDLVIVDTPNATLVSTQDKAQEVKKIVQQLQKQDREEQSFHRKVYRPWGWYDTIDTGEYFQVKRLHINSGAKLSLQKHNHRAEHWVVVNGIATVTKGDAVLTLNKGESTYVPLGVIHALENNTDEPLEIIEVQSGMYLGEDDIVRFEDIYGRVE
ncbi:Mannose-1-phosphate guanylyltransferase (GDP) (EC [uncultured Gammaproteobacteria bacterium]|jgi:mannose-1-phosphate guanylyltransferase/mannose-6-phosphate isomerase|nr:Mannose-1-phosphate guanylyltransferase (EC 2.7.7.13) / Mannose-6-phosphate isomerase (EC 5.3.1.8) [uncultured Gammaproteobacteria bacterium]VVH64261.1 Mannose-1-phosphate guanylyltransferase (GDP) (EC [uncultured Gammaproteobacteria bacterium]